MKTRPIHELISIAQAGGSFRVDAKAYSFEDVKRLGQALHNVTARIYLYNTAPESAADLATLARSSGGRFVFEE
jgi:hypothetical protein